MAAIRDLKKYFFHYNFSSLSVFSNPIGAEFYGPSSPGRAVLKGAMIGNAAGFVGFANSYMVAEMTEVEATTLLSILPSSTTRP